MMENAIRNQHPSKLEAWLMAVRIRTYPIPTIQVLAAAAAAYAFTGKCALWALVCTWLIGIFITMGTNLINDVYDYDRGGDPLNRHGQLKVLRAGFLSRKEGLMG